MRKSHIDVIFESLKEHLIENYPGTKNIAESLIDIQYKRCLIAEKEHYKDRRQFMHTGHEDMTICVSDSIEHLDIENIHGLFLHEIGHLIADQILAIYTDMMHNRPSDIKELPDAELRADAIIENIWGISIKYDENKIQWAKIG